MHHFVSVVKSWEYLECTVRRCMRETGRSKTVALNYCLKKAENRAGNQKVYNPSPFFLQRKKIRFICEVLLELQFRSRQSTPKNVLQRIFH